MPAPTPQDYRGKRILQHPFDENRKPVPPLIAAITDPGTGLIIGYLPLKATDNGDGTATLQVDTEMVVNGDVIVGDVKVASTDQTAANARFIRVDNDGTVHVVVDATPAVSDMNVEAWGGTLVSGADITPNIQNLDVDLSTRASEATLAALAVSAASIDTDIDTPLSSRASEATLLSVLAALDTVETKLQSIIDNTDTLEVNTDDLETKVQSVRDQLDVLLSTRSTEATLLSVLAAVDTLEALLQSVIDNTEESTASAVTSVARNVASVTLLAANASRKGATIFNDATAILFVKLGATASTTSFTVQIGNNSYYEVPFKYTGIIDGIWATAGAGNARITELT